ncbi:MAG: hypothetical protein AAGA17_05850 [Actinomycetota bacterium]
MDAEKRREERRRAARERVAQRREAGGDEAVERSLAEQRQQQAPASAEQAVERSATTTRQRTRRPASAATGISYRLSDDAMAALLEERDEQMAAGARQRAAIQGLVPFDPEEFEQRLGSADLWRLDRCSFGQCRKRPKWMAPARAEGTPRFMRAYCHEHVTPPE